MDSFSDRPFARFHESRESLTLVTGHIRTYLGESGPDMIRILGLQFGKDKVYLAVDDDDSLSVGRCPHWVNHANLVEHNLSNEEPWRTAIGKPLLWSWTMTDQDGIFDGIQLEFAENVETESVTVQLIRMPAELEVRIVDFRRVRLEREKEKGPTLET